MTTNNPNPSDQPKDQPKDHPRPDIPPKDSELMQKMGYTIGNAINSGSFSTVCRAEKKEEKNSIKMAVKVIDLSKTSVDYKNRFLPRELYMMTKLKHPNIIIVYEIFTLEKVRIYVFMELADGGDFLDLVTKEGAQPEPKAKSLYRGVADAMRYIHDQGFAHRDIKCENILLNKSKTVAKIADFGFSRTCFDNKTGQRRLSDTYCGSSAYAAPEILKVKPYDAMISDVWSMGIVLFVLVNNQLPFRDTKSDLRALLKLQLEKKYRIKDNLSEDCKDLIRKHLEPDIKLRYTMKKVLQHRWLALATTTTTVTS